MKTSIKNKFIYKYIFLYGIFFEKSRSEIINNKSFLELICEKDNEKTRESFSNMINRVRKIYLHPFNIITGGIPKFLIWQSTKFISNISNLFVNKDTLIKYGEFNRNKLINFLTALEEGKEKDFKDNIILDIGLDLLAFGDKASIFHENLEILHKWIDDKIIDATYDQSKISLSFKLKLIGLKLQLLEYMPPSFVSFTLNTFVSKLNSLFAPFKVFEVNKNFDNKSLIDLYKTNKLFQDFMKDLKDSKDEEKIKKYNNLSKVMEQGLLLPIKGVYKDIKDIDLKEASKSSTEKSSNTLGKLFKPIGDLLRKHDILTSHIDFSKIKNDYKNLLVEKNIKSENKIFLDADNLLQQEEQVKEIQFLRNSILYENAIIERLQSKNMFIPAFWMEYIVSKFQEKLENLFGSMVEGVIATLTLKTQNPYNNFIETIILSSEENIKLENFLKILIKNMKTNGPLPSLLVAVGNPQIEALIKNYVYYLIRKHPISRYKIRNPITSTKISMSKLSKKNMKPKELKTLAHKLFYENINSFNIFLKIHFLNEEVKYMNYISTLQIETLRNINKIVDYMYNPLYIGRKIFSIIEVSGLEWLCAPRNESKKKNTNSMVTSTFVTYVSGVLYKDRFLFAFTKDLNSVDEAVKSRFTICSKITPTGALDFYVILVRRYLLNLMIKYKNILLLNEDTFEKLLIDLSYEFYVKNWTGSEINRFFTELEDKKRLKSFNNQYNKQQILKLMSEVPV